MRKEVFRDEGHLNSVLERVLRKSSYDMEINLRFELDGYPKQSIEKIVQCAKKYIEANYRPKVSIKADELRLTSSEFIDFIDLEDELKKEDVEFFLSEDADEYSLDQTISAYLKCKEFADFVKQTETSPFEKYLMIYRFVTDRVYNDSKESVGAPRNLISILTSDEIVCVGYAKLLKFLCDEVGIKCECQSMDVIYKNKEENGRHRNNIVYLKDEKYGIDGLYYADACWDSIEKDECPFLKYSYAFVPISDVEKMNTQYFRFDNNHLLYSDHSEIEYIVDVEAQKKYAEFMNVSLQSEYNDFFDNDFMTILSNLKPYMQKVAIILKENEIPSDIVSTNKYKKIPTKFTPEFLVAMAMLKPPRLDIIQQVIKEMKVFYESGGKLDENTEKSKIYKESGYDDIYETLQGDSINSICSIMAVYDVGYYLESYHNTPTIIESIKQARATSKPIPLQAFIEANDRTFGYEGVPQKDVPRVTRAIVKRVCARSKAIFNKDAINCFVSDENSDLESGKGE